MLLGFGPLKMNREVTLADELNFGLAVWVKQGRSEDEEKIHCFHSAGENGKGENLTQSANWKVRRSVGALHVR